MLSRSRSTDRVSVDSRKHRRETQRFTDGIMAPGGDQLAYLAGWDAREVQKRWVSMPGSPSLSTAAMLGTPSAVAAHGIFQAQLLDFETIKLFLKYITSLLKRRTVVQRG